MSQHRKSSRIPVGMWRDTDFASLSPAAPNARTLFLYLLTCPDSTAVPGLSTTDPETIAGDLDWTPRQVLSQFGEIANAGFAVADWDRRSAFVFGAVTDNPPPNPNHAVAWRRALSEMQPTAPAFAAACEVRQVLSAMCGLFLPAFEREPAECRTSVPVWMRANVVARDGLVCGICGGDVDPGDVHLDHVKPWSRGGRHSLTNLRVTHSLCNIRRGNRE